MILIKNFYCMSDSGLQCNNTIVTDIECNIRIYRLPLGRGTDQWKWYCPRLQLGQYHFHWSVLRSLGSLYYSVILWILQTGLYLYSKNIILLQNALPVKAIMDRSIMAFFKKNEDYLKFQNSKINKKKIKVPNFQKISLFQNFQKIFQNENFSKKFQKFQIS